MVKKTFCILFALCSVLFLFTSCKKNFGYEEEKETQEVNTWLESGELQKYKPYKMGFVFSGFIGDKGWNAVHNEARRELEKNLGLKTEFVSNAVSEREIEDAIEKLIDDGCNIISTCSLSYIDKTIEEAKKHPDIYFFNCSGVGDVDNLSTFFGRKYQANYLCGIAAGMRTETNKIGYVAPTVYPESLRLLDSFALGVKSVNKDAEVFVKFTGKWFDPPKEKSNAIQLINYDCDVIAQNQNSRSAQAAAQQATKCGKRVWCIGENISGYHDAPDSYLTSSLFDFFPYYKGEIDKIIAGTWESSDYWGGLEDKVISIDTLSENCAEGTREAIEREYERIVSGENKIFDGPIYDNNGNLKIKKGEALSDQELRQIDWYVDGVTVIN